MYVGHVLVAYSIRITRRVRGNIEVVEFCSGLYEYILLLFIIDC